MGEVSTDTQQAVKDQKWEIISFSDLEIQGRKTPTEQHVGHQ